MRRDIDGVLYRVSRTVAAFDRHDFVLTAIPLAFVGAAIVGKLLAIPLEVAVFVGFLIAALAMIDGLFLHPPSGLQRN
ncbi:hypothetical protein ACFQHN_04350 [Natrialbaceae archaeon GCM10025896]